MAKCIITVDKDQIVLRMSDQQAAARVATGGWEYCPKWIWKGKQDAEHFLRERRRANGID